MSRCPGSSTRCSLVGRLPCPRSRLVFDVSPARTSLPCRVGVAPHDHCIFSVVSVVTTSDATRDEAEALVEGDRGEVRDAHLQRVAALGVVARHLEQPARASPWRSRAAGARGRRRRSSRATHRRSATARDSRRAARRASRRRSRGSSASRARRRTSSATRASGTRRARSARSHRGRRARAGAARSSRRPTSSHRARGRTPARPPRPGRTRLRATRGARRAARAARSPPGGTSAPRATSRSR